MTKKIGITVLVMLLWWPPAILYPDRGNIRFERLSIEHGLSQSIVECILQDRRGFMWFGTEDGLNKYDGYTFSIIRENPNDPNSISHDNILSLYEDTSGLLWIGTFHGGITVFDQEQQQYTRYRNIPNDPNSLSSDVVRAIYEDRQGYIWLGTGNGLDRFDKKDRQFRHYRIEAGTPGTPGIPGTTVTTVTQERNEILSLCADQQDLLWIGTNGSGLYRFDTVPGTARHIPLEGSKNNPGNQSGEVIRAIYCDRQDNLWIGSNHGLYCLEPGRTRWVHYDAGPNQPDSLSNPVVKDIRQDHEGTIWIGTEDGLNQLDLKTGKFTVYRTETSNPHSLSNDEVRAIYEDRSGVLWFGTYGSGINKYAGKNKKFVHYRSTPNDTNSLGSNIVFAIHEDKQGILWVGTYWAGIDRFDRKKNRVTHYRAEAGVQGSLSSDKVRIIFEDRSAMYWIGTDGGGLNRFDRETGKFTVYRHQPGNPHSLSRDEIRCIYEDSGGTLWIGTLGGGLNKFDRQRGIFTCYRVDDRYPNCISSDVVRQIVEYPRGILWIGTYGGGLNRFDCAAGSFLHYRAQHNQPDCLSNDYILSLHLDDDGILWLGTEGGLNRFDREKGVFSHFSSEDGLPGETILGILEDDRHFLWLSTNHGLCKFDSRTFRVKNYFDVDGLQSNEFNGGAFFKSPGGEMFFGGINGLTAFYPQDIKDNTYIPPVVITAFQRLNKYEDLGKPLSDLEELVLSYKDYFFSFEFAALDYTVPGKNKYAYRMEGLDKNWIYRDANRRFAMFTHLDPGSYVLRVKGTNNDGIWNETGATLKIMITPPIWQTWWFRALVILLMVISGWALYRRRMKSIRLKTRLETELQTAQAAQMSIMPRQAPPAAGFDIAGRCVPAHEVGGDFFDYLWRGEGNSHVGIVVGDVSGKSMKAAMTAVMSDGIIFSKAFETQRINELMSHLNRALYYKTGRDSFLALLIVSIDSQTKEMSYCNAGLPQPLLITRSNLDGSRQVVVQPLKTSGSKVAPGINKESEYREEKIALKMGDTLVLFTDGIYEAMDGKARFYGKVRLERFLETMNTAKLTAEGIIDEIMKDIDQFTGGVVQRDDMALVVIKVL